MSDAVAISPVPVDVIRDRSGGYRAHVTTHAIRRYAERTGLWGCDLAETYDDVSDKEILAVFRSCEIPVRAIRARLAYFGGVVIRCGGIGATVDGVGLVVVNGTVRTVLPRRGHDR